VIPVIGYIRITNANKMGGSHSSAAGLDATKAMFGDMTWTQDKYDVLLAVHFMATHGARHEKNKLNKAFVTDLLQLDDDGNPEGTLTELCFKIGVMQEIQKHLHKSIFDVTDNDIEYPPIVYAALRNELKGIEPPRAAPTVFLKAVCVVVYPLPYYMEAAANVIGCRDHYATHFVLELLDSRERTYYVERHDGGVDFFQYLEVRGRKKAVRDEKVTVHRVVLPEHRSVAMDDIPAWVHHQKSLRYAKFSRNCKRFCWDFFCDFNIDVPDCETFERNIESEYAAAKAGKVSRHVAPPNELESFEIRYYMDAQPWYDVCRMFVLSLRDDVKADDFGALEHQAFVTRTVNGVYMARRLDSNMCFLRSPKADVKTMEVDDARRKACSDLYTVVRAIKDATPSDDPLAYCLPWVFDQMKFIMARFQPWNTEANRHGNYANRASKLDFSAIPWAKES
jgi:hypothetical protein